MPVYRDLAETSRKVRVFLNLSLKGGLTDKSSLGRPHGQVFLTDKSSKREASRTSPLKGGLTANPSVLETPTPMVLLAAPEYACVR